MQATRRLMMAAGIVLLPVWLSGCNHAPTRPTVVANALTVNCESTAMNTIGQQSHCAARVSRSDGSTTDVTATAQWSSSDVTRVTVNGGVITAIAPGVADIIGTFEGVTGRQAVNVSVGCAFTVSPDAISLGGGSGSQMVTVTAAPAGCAPSAWTATTSDAAAVSVSPTAGSGNGIVTLTVSSNATSGARMYSATIAGQTVTITQSAPPPPSPPPPATYALRLTLVEGQQLSGPHAGTVTGPNGFACTFGLSKGDGACAQSFQAGTSVRLTVKLAWPGFPPGAPVPDDRPLAWAEGCDAVIGTDTCIVNINGDRKVTIGIGAS
jgi:hypothetical protein